METIWSFVSAGNFIQLSAFLLILLGYYVFFLARKPGQIPLPPGTRRVPIVDGALPIVGHALSLRKDMVGFTTECCKKYGLVFQLKIFRKWWVIVCDHNLVREYYRNGDKNYSLDEFITESNMKWAHFDQEPGFNKGEDLFRTTSIMKPEGLLRSVASVQLSVESLAKRCDDEENGKFKVSILDEFFEWAVRASYAANIGGKCAYGPGSYGALKKLYKLMSSAIGLSFVMPRWISKPLVLWRLKQLRRPLKAPLLAIIKTYRDDPLKNDSNLIRSAVDRVDQHGNQMDDSDIADSLLMAVASGPANITYGVSHTLTYLALPENSQILADVREECKNLQNDLDGLIKAPLLEACILEATRLNTQLFTNHRKPIGTQGNNLMGNYFIGPEVDSVTLAGHMLQVEVETREGFEEPKKFKPSRLLGKSKSRSTVQNITTWGGGVTKCPGKPFALTQMKIALSHIVMNFDFQVAGEVGARNYLNTDSFVERITEMVFERSKVDMQ